MSVKENSDGKKTISRREFLKKTGMLAAGAVAASTMFQPTKYLFAGGKEGPAEEGVMKGERMAVPLADKAKFAGVTLNWLEDTSWGFTTAIVNPHIVEECGVTLGEKELEIPSAIS